MIHKVSVRDQSASIYIKFIKQLLVFLPMHLNWVHILKYATKYIPAYRASTRNVAASKENFLVGHALHLSKYTGT